MDNPYECLVLKPPEHLVLQRNTVRVDDCVFTMCLTEGFGWVVEEMHKESEESIKTLMWNLIATGESE